MLGTSGTYHWNKGLFFLGHLITLETRDVKVYNAVPAKPSIESSFWWPFFIQIGSF